MRLSPSHPIRVHEIREFFIKAPISIDGTVAFVGSHPANDASLYGDISLSTEDLDLLDLVTDSELHDLFMAHIRSEFLWSQDRTFGDLDSDLENAVFNYRWHVCDVCGCDSACDDDCPVNGGELVSDQGNWSKVHFQAVRSLRALSAVGYDADLDVALVVPQRDLAGAVQTTLHDLREIRDGVDFATVMEGENGGYSSDASHASKLLAKATEWQAITKFSLAKLATFELHKKALLEDTCPDEYRSLLSKDLDFTEWFSKVAC